MATRKAQRRRRNSEIRKEAEEASGIELAAGSTNGDLEGLTSAADPDALTILEADAAGHVYTAGDTSGALDSVTVQAQSADAARNVSIAGHTVVQIPTAFDWENASVAETHARIDAIMARRKEYEARWTKKQWKEWYAQKPWHYPRVTGAAWAHTGVR